MLQAMNLWPSSKHFRRTAVLIFFVLASLIYILASINSAEEPIHFFILDSNRSPPFDAHYFGRNEKCRVPDVEPHHVSILKYVKREPPVVCSRHAPLTYTTAEEGRHAIIVDKGAVSKYIGSLDRLNCCYSVITRENENKNRESKCVNFTLKAVLDESVEYLYVRCLDKKNGKKVYDDMHAVVQKRPSKDSKNVVTTNEEKGLNASSNGQREARTTTATPVNGASRSLNVLILGIDSMSRLNFMRTMPRTVTHLISNNWLEFRSYNKVGDNTVPNLLAILAGINLDQIRSLNCYPKKGVFIDKCPYIWNDFHRRGYLTAYAEDEPDLATFNFNKGGFKKQPTDIYFRPFMLAASSKLHLVKKDGEILCLGPKTTTETFLKYTLDLITTYNKMFALIWLNNFSHNNLNTPAAFDGIFFKFMEQLKASGALNDTLIVFLSDHGQRFGKIRETYVGWLEERLPFFYMWFPEWFIEAYPDAYQNVKAHRDLLTSPFDVHLTLKEIVDEKIGVSVNGSEGCQSCRSLFAAPVKDRSCDEAGISTHWCTCAAQIPTSTSSEIVVNATQFAIDDIMSKLIRAGNETIAMCASLELKTIFSARLKETYNVKLKKEYKDYVVVFYTSPGMALFDATIRYSGPGEYKVMGFISRINSYAADSKCMADKELKLYCHCVNL